MLAIKYDIVAITQADLGFIGDPLVKGMRDPFHSLGIQAPLVLTIFSSNGLIISSDILLSSLS